MTTKKLVAAAALAAGLTPAAESAARPETTDKALRDDSTPAPVTTGRPDGSGDGRKN